MTGGQPLPADVVEQILAETDGVPLFVEELTKAVLESGLLAGRGRSLRAVGPAAAARDPGDACRTSLMARLDRLGAGQGGGADRGGDRPGVLHELLAAVADLAESELRDALDQLSAAELVFRRGTPPEAIYTFKHALVQDAAYQSLLKSRRQQLHARIAAPWRSTSRSGRDASPNCWRITSPRRGRPSVPSTTG